MLSGLNDYIKSFFKLERANPGLIHRADILASHLGILDRHFDLIRDISRVQGRLSPAEYFRQEIVTQTPGAARLVGLTMGPFIQKMAHPNYKSAFIESIQRGATFREALRGTSRPNARGFR